MAADPHDRRRPLRRPRRAAAWLTPLLLAVSCNPVSEITGPSVAPALQCSGYVDGAQSPYRLPYPPGTAYLVGQANCSAQGPPGRHHPGSVFKYGYDFLMTIGTPIVASRAGIVVGVETRFADFNQVEFDANYVFVEHADGTIARYFHLTSGGAVVRTGERVEPGTLIGYSGASGLSAVPHLHFDVVPLLCPARDCTTLPVTFHNTRAHPGGLVEGETYLALDQ